MSKDDSESPTEPIHPLDRDENSSPVLSASVARQPSSQFRISTLLSWTAVICFLIAAMRVDTMFPGINGNIGAPDFFFGLFIFALFFTPAYTCIPFLIDRLLLGRGLNFSTFWRIWLMMCVGVYSFLMLMLATIAFEADWKGSKGLHWSYYSLDNWAGTTLWPIYVIGVGLFIAAVFNPRWAKRNPMFLIGTATCAAISIWYVIATLVFNFTADQTDGAMMAIVPGGAGVCYCLYCAIILRNREFTWKDLATKPKFLLAWFSGLFVSILVKYPLARQIYQRLPDEPPEDCFIVTAATRGHRQVVGTWFDANRRRVLNSQLLTFWEFERWLKLKTPRTHRCIRAVYNRIGRIVARAIVFRWQADLVYWLLKPIELLAGSINRWAK